LLSNFCLFFLQFLVSNNANLWFQIQTSTKYTKQYRETYREIMDGTCLRTWNAPSTLVGRLVGWLGNRSSYVVQWKHLARAKWSLPVIHPFVQSNSDLARQISIGNVAHRPEMLVSGQSCGALSTRMDGTVSILHLGRDLIVTMPTHKSHIMMFSVKIQCDKML
jgi:hypothetical protein